jgi:hypothetical protein
VRGAPSRGRGPGLLPGLSEAEHAGPPLRGSCPPARPRRHLPPSPAAPCSGATALHFAAAAKRNATAAVDVLLTAGASPEAVDDMGCMPYERADDPGLRAKLGGPDPRLFEYAGAAAAGGPGGGARGPGSGGGLGAGPAGPLAAAARLRPPPQPRPHLPAHSHITTPPAESNNAEGLRELVMSGAARTVRALDPEGRHAANIAVAACNGTAALELLLELDKGGVGWGLGPGSGGGGKGAGEVAVRPRPSGRDVLVIPATSSAPPPQPSTLTPPPSPHPPQSSPPCLT